MNHWGVIALLLVMFIAGAIRSNKHAQQLVELKQQLSELSTMVQEHENLLNSDYLKGATEFYKWHINKN